METLRIDELVAFDPVRQTRQRLVMTDRIEMELVCYEPGQNTVEHHHVGQDEIFIVLDGRGTIVVGGEETPVSSGSVVLAPAETPHAIRTTDESRLTLVFVKAPGRGSRRRERAHS